MNIRKAKEALNHLRIEPQDAEDDEDLNVWYRPKYETLALERKTRALSDQAQYTESLYERLIALIARWDLKDGDEVVPLTLAALEGVPTKSLVYIWNKVQEDISPPLAKSPPSENGSSQTESAEAPPPGESRSLSAVG